MKRLTVLGFGLLSSLLMVPFAGCGSSNGNGGTGTTSGSSSGATSSSGAAHDSGMTSSSGTTSSSGSSSGHVGDSGPSGDASDASDGGDGGSCLVPVTGFTPVSPYVPASPTLGACMASDISTFLAACVDNISADTCNAWLSANVAIPDAGGAGTTCGNCIFNLPSNNGAGWVDPFVYQQTGGMLLFNPNYAACFQLTDSTHGAACGGAFNNINSCQDAACGNCGDLASYSDCLATADGTGGDCSSYAATARTSCAPDELDGGPFTTCIPSAISGNLDDDWTLIIGMICGGADGG
jgi:hypothetical protein